jgi:hypothetical protein
MTSKTEIDYFRNGYGPCSHFHEVPATVSDSTTDSMLVYSGNSTDYGSVHILVIRNGVHKSCPNSALNHGYYVKLQCFTSLKRPVHPTSIYYGRLIYKWNIRLLVMTDFCLLFSTFLLNMSQLRVCCPKYSCYHRTLTYSTGCFEIAYA